MLDVIVRVLRKLFSGQGSRTHVLSEAEFREAFIELLEQRAPDTRITVQRGLELKIQRGDAPEHAVFLDNAYATYRLHPANPSDILARYATALLEKDLEHPPEKVDAERIVPVIKDAAFLEEANQAMSARGKKAIESIDERYNDELLILYAEDTPKNIRYLTESDLAKAGLNRSELRTRAVRNLERLLPKVEFRGEHGVQMLTAGGDYEASLLLLDSVWTDSRLRVDGEIIAAIPARDLLFITGSNNADHVTRLHQIAGKMVREVPYRLTDRLFIRRDGQFHPWSETDEPDGTNAVAQVIKADAQHQ